MIQKTHKNISMIYVTRGKQCAQDKFSRAN